MIRSFSTTAVASLMIFLPSFVTAEEPSKSPYQIVDEAPDSAWRNIDPENTIYLDLAGGRVVIELAPQFAPGHVANTKALIREGFYDDASFYRIQDGYVAQGGAGEGSVDSGKKPTVGKREIPLEAFRSEISELPFTPLGNSDPYAPEAGFSDGFPVGRDPQAGEGWIAHCQGAFAMARGSAPDSGGSEFYVAIGHAPRFLDRNVTVYGRVVHGLRHVTTLTPANAGNGVFENPADRQPIIGFAVASDVPDADRLDVQVMDTTSDSFKAYVDARRNRRGEWFIEAKNHIDLCGAPVPTRLEP